MPKCEHVNLLRLGVNHKAISSICFNMLQLLRLVNYEPNRYNNEYLFIIKCEKMTEQKKVIIHLHTEIDDAGEKEFISERHEGTYFKKEDRQFFYIQIDKTKWEKSKTSLPSSLINFRLSVGVLFLCSRFFMWADKQNVCINTHRGLF